LARALKADLVHVQYSASPLLRTPFVATIHDVSFFVGPHWFRPKDRFLLRSSVPKAAKRARVVLTVSEASKRDIVKHLSVPERKVVATPLAPHPDLHAAPADQVASRLDRLGVARPYALSVSTRWPRKNMDLAVRAMERLAASTPHRLVLTGKAGWGEAAQGHRTQAAGYVAVEDLAALYAGADLYLCPSLYEGFGLPVVEAFALGCPVVVGPGGALPEVAGNAGFVLPDYEEETWHSAIESLLADPDRRAALAEAGRQRAKEFSWTKMAQGVWAAYERAMSG
jgi:alpha-1,3-rhamnosyl/mannosyltransferase